MFHGLMNHPVLMISAVMPGNGPSMTNCGEATTFMALFWFSQFHLPVVLTNTIASAVSIETLLICDIRIRHHTVASGE